MDAVVVDAGTKLLKSGFAVPDQPPSMVISFFLCYSPLFYCSNLSSFSLCLHFKNAFTMIGPIFAGIRRQTLKQNWKVRSICWPLVSFTCSVVSDKILAVITHRRSLFFFGCWAMFIWRACVWSTGCTQRRFFFLCLGWFDSFIYFLLERNNWQKNGVCHFGELSQQKRSAWIRTLEQVSTFTPLGL